MRKLRGTENVPTISHGVLGFSTTKTQKHMCVLWENTCECYFFSFFF